MAAPRLTARGSSSPPLRSDIAPDEDILVEHVSICLRVTIETPIVRPHGRALLPYGRLIVKTHAGARCYRGANPTRSHRWSALNAYIVADDRWPVGVEGTCALGVLPR